MCIRDRMVLGYVGMLLGYLDGGVFLLIFAAYLIWMIGSAKKARAAHKESQMMLEEGEILDEDIQILPLWKCASFIVGGIAVYKRQVLGGILFGVISGYLGYRKVLK